MQITFANSHWPFLGGDWASRVRPQTSVDITSPFPPEGGTRVPYLSVTTSYVMTT